MGAQGRVAASGDGRDLADRIRSEMDRRKLGKRGLARLLAEGVDDQREIERFRRAIYRALDGGLPEDEIASRFEERLDWPTGSVPRAQEGRQAAGAAPSRVALAQTQAALQATVDRLLLSVEALERRVAELERQRGGRVRRTARGATQP